MHAVLPLSAYLLQVAVAAFGLLATNAVLGRRHGWLQLGLAFPVGYALVGLVQLATFVAGVASLALPLTAAAFAASAIGSAIRYARSQDGASEATLRWSDAPSLLVITVLTVSAFLVSRSSDLAESDPRWQWAFRAKNVAAFDGFQAPAFQDTTLLHINPYYPLLFSSYEASVLRASGDVDAVHWVRAAPVFFLLSHQLLLWAACRAAGFNAWACPLALALVALAGKFWSLAIDENYVDFPIAVLALACFLAVERNALLLAGLLAAAITLTKSEGVLLCGVLALVTLVQNFLDRRRADRMLWLRLAPFALGAVLAKLLDTLATSQIAEGFVMENVTFSDLSLTSALENASRVPDITARYAAILLDPARFGVLLPLIVLSGFSAQPRGARAATWACLIYLLLMIAPFTFSNFRDGDYISHINVVADRLFFQVIPLSTLGLAGMFNAVRFRGHKPPPTPGVEAE